ncbi:MAG TPA: hypothetical protein VFN25_07830 [Dokdonella sp.]|nr:hypothetical protein [Dokdonella sp.]HET9032798.1 hypothetical protein [Dokdonella sp.]
MIIECAPDIDQALGDRGVGDNRIAPDGIEQLMLGDQPPAILHKIAQDFVGFGSQFQLGFTAQESTAGNIQRELTESEAMQPIGSRHARILSVMRIGRHSWRSGTTCLAEYERSAGEASADPGDFVPLQANP